MKRFCTFLFIFMIAVINLPAVSKFSVPNAKKLSRSTVSIKGPWDFYWGRFLTEGEEAEPDCQVKIPSAWNSYDLPEEIHKIAKTGKGSGTYRILVTDLKPLTEYAFRTYDLASTAVTIIANGTVIFTAGIPYMDWTQTKADQQMKLARFKSDDKGQVFFTIYVSNNIYRNGGVWNPLEIGELDFMSMIYDSLIGYFSGLAGVLFAIVIYSLFLYIFRKNRASLLLGLFTISLIIRILSANFSIFKQLFPNMPYMISLRLEYSALYFSPITFILYLKYVDRSIFNKLKMRFLIIPGILLGTVAIFAPIFISNRFVPILQVYCGISAIACIVFMIIYTVKYRNATGVVTLIALILLFLGAINDIMITDGHGLKVYGVQMLPFAFAFFVYSQITLLAIRQSKNESELKEIDDYLTLTNKAYSRFVPKKLLELFKKSDITELQIGDKFSKKMMVLTADIRNFTATSEEMTGLQVFEFLNGYFGKIGPIIDSYGGVIEKYLGDGIVVFFPEHYENAIYCALKMQEAMIELRKQFSSQKLPELKIGIGIHFGDILVGTAGDNSRMSEVSLSEELEVLFKAEESTKTYGKAIIATKQALDIAKSENTKNFHEFEFYEEKIKDSDLYFIYSDKINGEL